MSATGAARSFMRSTARLSSGLKSRPGTTSTSSPFRIPKQNSLANRIFRSPVEMSCSVETLLPYHTATASALLTSMLSASPRAFNWTPEGQSKPR
ncbi:protein NUCLEAR FUSION DEFECTIVE 6, mitochondrial-like isoform X2 [Mercurialis annua]|uniref:protein NUCLEAR FUSION DEFECTIVE 6, mitochondrial-like isoform X2 n=1 Tax=Mercurialis annua TaxID=3986 RepID=UPI00215E4406|nr:protein NUCLEAR FUSION DEFECTIVE 6, mitochondrial-like isoform X2 [Mercurialis annua]